jgi:hypothetical protein
MSERSWPEKDCRNCGKKIRLVKTPSGWIPYELNVFKPHDCQSGDVYDHPEKIVPLFNPRKNKFQK